MDLESDLRRVLHERSTPAGTEDPVPGIHAGMQRRRRRQRVQQLTAALSVTAVALTGALLLRPGSASDDVDALASKVPTGFLATDLTFLSTTEGYALGTTPCGEHARCTVLLATENGGSDWERRKAPQAGVTVGNGPSAQRCDLATCVAQLRFARSSDGGVVGYAFGPDYVMTRDQETWTREPVGGRVQGLEAAHGSVVRVVSEPNGDQRVERSDVGSAEWTEVLRYPGRLHQVHLRRQGARLVLTDFWKGHDGRSTSDVRVSDDGGSTWSTGAREVCGARGFLRSAALGKDHQVVVLCVPESLYGAYVRQSTDGGRTFGPPLEVGGGLSDGAQLVALPSRWLVAGEDGRSGVFAVASSSDEGRTWRRVAREQDLPLPSAVLGYLDNSNSTTAWWVGVDGRFLFRTQDAGDTWTSTRFR